MCITLLGFPSSQKNVDLTVAYRIYYVGLPILAQRLLINIRRVDDMGSQPLASTLLFAPPAPSVEDEGNLERTEPQGIDEGHDEGLLISLERMDAGPSSA